MLSRANDEAKWTIAELHRAKALGGRAWMGSQTIRPKDRRRIAAEVWAGLEDHLEMAGNMVPVRAGTVFPVDTGGVAVPVDLWRLPHLSPEARVASMWRRFAAALNERIQHEFTLMFDRLKKATKLRSHQLRYMVCVELHKDGWPHLHCIIIETGRDPSGKYRVSKRGLKSQWRLGFSKFTLIGGRSGDEKSAWYVCKYLTKTDVRVRLRHSHGWGRCALPKECP